MPARHLVGDRGELSARFPTITPGGRVSFETKGLLPECKDRPELQLIDGGDAEGSGIGTLAVVAPRWCR